MDRQIQSAGCRRAFIAATVRRSALNGEKIDRCHFGWPGRVRSTGRVAQRQEAAPCQLISKADLHGRVRASWTSLWHGIRMARPLVAARPDRPRIIRKSGTAGPPADDLD